MLSLMIDTVHKPVSGLRHRASSPIWFSLENVCLDIPVATTETRSLKASLLRSVTGGRLNRSRGGAVITALENVSCTVREGERWP